MVSSDTEVSANPVPKINIHKSQIDTRWNQKRMARGIKNTGNTCYMASTIQCLQHIPAWNNFIINEHKEMCKEDHEECFVCKLMRLAKASFNSAEEEPKSTSPAEEVERGEEAFETMFEQISISKQEDDNDSDFDIFSLTDDVLPVNNVELSDSTDLYNIDSTSKETSQELHGLKEESEPLNNTGFSIFQTVLKNFYLKRINLWKQYITPTLDTSTVSADEIAIDLKKLGTHLRRYRQEDAHEFLVCLFEKIQKNLTSSLTNLDPASEMTTALGKIFGGYLKNRIVCYGCKIVSDNYEEFFNLSLEITEVTSVEEALDKFFNIEYLQNYPCEQCKVGTEAGRKYCINSLPSSLIIHLKRYKFEGSRLLKISEHVKFEENLDFKNHLSRLSKEDDSNGKYMLNGVTVHCGSSLNGGHYKSYVRDPADNSGWYCMNDSSVTKTSWEKVVSEEAYLLYYVKC